MGSIPFSWLSLALLRKRQGPAMRGSLALDGSLVAPAKSTLPYENTDFHAGPSWLIGQRTR
jgi:hypothetical protein